MLTELLHWGTRRGCSVNTFKQKTWSCYICTYSCRAGSTFPGTIIQPTTLTNNVKRAASRFNICWNISTAQQRLWTLHWLGCSFTVEQGLLKTTRFKVQRFSFKVFYIRLVNGFLSEKYLRVFDLFTQKNPGNIFISSELIPNVDLSVLMLVTWRWQFYYNYIV